MGNEDVRGFENFCVVLCDSPVFGMLTVVRVPLFEKDLRKPFTPILVLSPLFDKVNLSTFPIDIDLVNLNPIVRGMAETRLPR
jgi:hypothetical protein